METFTANEILVLRFAMMDRIRETQECIQKTEDEDGRNSVPVTLHEEEELALPDNSAIFFIYSKFKIYF